MHKLYDEMMQQFEGRNHLIKVQEFALAMRAFNKSKSYDRVFEVMERVEERL